MSVIEDGPGSGPRDDAFEVGPEVLLSQCAYCRHAQGAFLGLPTCQAFPGGIPDAVLTNDFDHRTPHPDEARPLRFEPHAWVPREKLEALYARLDAAR